MEWGETGLGAGREGSGLGDRRGVGREGSGGRGKAIEEGGTMGWTEGNQDRGVREGGGKWGREMGGGGGMVERGKGSGGRYEIGKRMMKGRVH